jgi:hypothetical protein
MPGTGTEVRAAKIAAPATNAPLKYPTYLDNEWQILSGSNSTHALAARDKSKAAFVAYKLEAGASVARTVPVMKAHAPVGSNTRQVITQATTGAGRVAIRTQRGLYLVNTYRSGPAIASRKAAVRPAARATGNRRVATSHVAVRAQAQHLTKSTASTPKVSAQHVSGSPTNTSSGIQLPNLSSVFDLKQAQSSLASSPLGKLLKLDSPKPSTKTDSGETVPPALQVTSTSSTDGGSLTPTGTPPGVHEAPVPEPGTLAFAGLAIAGVVLRRRKSAVVRSSC